MKIRKDYQSQITKKAENIYEILFNNYELFIALCATAIVLIVVLYLKKKFGAP